MTGPSEVQMVMAGLAAMRAERINAQIAAELATPPTFKPTAADVIAQSYQPTPQQAANALWEILNPEAAARERQSAIDLLARAAGLSHGSPPGASTSWPGRRTPSAAPGLPTGPVSTASIPRATLPMQAKPPVEWPSKKYGYNSDKLMGVLGDAFKAQVTAALYLEWVRMAKYPWWWGEVTSLAQVESSLSADLAVYEKSWLPPTTKAIARWNISAAMNWVREQRATIAARYGGDPVPF